MTKNEIVAMPDLNQPLISEIQYRLIENFLNGKIPTAYRGGNVVADYRYLHEAWEKFRDLKGFDNGNFSAIHELHCRIIGINILYKSITEAFDELVKGIEWYNNLTYGHDKK